MRLLAAVAILLFAVVGLGGMKFLQISKLMAFGKAMAQAGPPPEAVGTTVAKADNWEGVLSAVGTVAAARGVAVSSEVPGVVKAIRFESGAAVRAGQVLVELDSSVERPQLASSEARLQLATAAVNRARRLHKDGAATQADLDKAESEIKTFAADVAALRAQIERKTVRAPFAGRVGIRQVNLGQYLAAGTTLTVLESLGAVYVDFWLPQQSLPLVPAGTPVRVALAGAGQQEWSGRVAAVEPTVDENTRNVKLRAAITKDADRLHPGMFVNVAAILPTRAPVVAIPATAVVYATYGNTIFVVEEQRGPNGPAKVARQKFVKLGDTRGDYVAVLEGLKASEEVITTGAFKLRNGAPIVVNNALKLKAELSPVPANR